MYVHDEVRLGSENTLICYVTGFYPPRLTVKWTRNNNNVTQGVSSSQIHINNDGTFNQFSTLKFTPQEGDMYTCTVEHSALEGPMTRYWGETLQQINCVTHSPLTWIYYIQHEALQSVMSLSVLIVLKQFILDNK